MLFIMEIHLSQVRFALESHIAVVKLFNDM